MRLDRTTITEKSDWICRREETLRQAYQYIYGVKPPKPTTVTGTVSNSQVSISIQHQGRSASFTASVQLPTSGTAPYPAVISFDGSGVASQMRSRGVAVINFSTGTFGGAAFTAFDTINGTSGTQTVGNTTKWSWGVSRIIDVLQANPTSMIDETKLAVTGCSYAGKGAFVAGAFDERISLTVPVESGIGGVPSYKLVPQIEPNPSGSGSGPEQPQHAINNNWLPSNSLVAQHQKLPVDTHQVIGLIAPRGLLIVGNTGGQGANYKNLDFKTEYATAMAGKEIYKALGFETNITYDSRNVTHCQYNTGTDTALTANINKFLKGTNATTGTFTTDWEGVRTSPAPYIDWTTPTLGGTFD
jgi:hypothetical protein